MHITVWYVLAGEKRRGLLREVITIVLQQIVPKKRVKIINSLKSVKKKKESLRGAMKARCDANQKLLKVL